MSSTVASRSTVIAVDRSAVAYQSLLFCLIIINAVVASGAAGVFSAIVSITCASSIF
jgi:hypothetical protein